MRISKHVYGYILVFILLGGLFITKMFGVWEIYDRDGGGGKHNASAAVVEYLDKYNL